MNIVVSEFLIEQQTKNLNLPIYFSFGTPSTDECFLTF